MEKKEQKELKELRELKEQREGSSSASPSPSKNVSQNNIITFFFTIIIKRKLNK